jgi:hypothetical protein
MWVARWRESAIQPDGTVGRILRSETLGLVSEIPSRREARILLQDRLAALNSGQRRAEATMSFGTFVTEQIEPVVANTKTRNPGDLFASSAEALAPALR